MPQVLVTPPRRSRLIPYALLYPIDLLVPSAVAGSETLRARTDDTEVGFVHGLRKEMCSRAHVHGVSARVSMSSYALVAVNFTVVRPFTLSTLY